MRSYQPLDPDPNASFVCLREKPQHELVSGFNSSWIIGNELLARLAVLAVLEVHFSVPHEMPQLEFQLEL